jgi:hypothetical protein
MIVREEKIEIDGKSYDKITEFDPATGKFRIELPDIVAKELEAPFVEGYTLKNRVYGENARLEDVDWQYEQLISDYKFQGKRKKKIILYSFAAQTPIKQKPENHELFSKDMFDKYQLQWHEGGIALALDYHVLIRTLPSGLLRDMRGEKYHPNPGYTQIDWTQEREDFFVRLSEKMNALIMSIDHFTSDEKRFLKALDEMKFLTTGFEAKE